MGGSRRTCRTEHPHPEVRVLTQKKSGVHLWQPCNISTEKRKEWRSSRGWRVAAAKCTEGEKEARSWCPDRSRRGWKQTPGSRQLPVYSISSLFSPLLAHLLWPLAPLKPPRLDLPAPSSLFSFTDNRLSSSSSSSSPRFITFNYLNYRAP